MSFHQDKQAIIPRSFESSSREIPLSLEQQLVDAVERGQKFNPDHEYLSSYPDDYIRADFIRNLLLNLAKQPGRPSLEDVVLTPFGIHIGAAKKISDGTCIPHADPTNSTEWLAAPRVPIKGCLDLAHLTADDGAPLPPLLLEWCDFEQIITMREARLSSVSFYGSRFPGVCVRDAHISGELNLSFCGPPPHKIGGLEQLEYFPFSGQIFEFCIDEKENKRIEDEGKSDKSTVPDYYMFKALGSSNEKQNDPLPLPHILPEKCQISPCILDARAATVLGSIHIQNSNFCRNHVEKNPFSPSEGNINYAIELSHAQVRDSIDFSLSVVLGGINLSSADIDDDIWFKSSRIFCGGEDAEFSSDTSDNEVDLGPAIRLQLTKIGGLLGIRKNESGAKREGFDHTLIRGPILGIGIQAREIWVARAVLCRTSRDATAIWCPKANIEQSITIGGYTTEESHNRVLANGVISFENASIGKNVEFHHVSYEPANRISRRGTDKRGESLFCPWFLNHVTPDNRDLQATEGDCTARTLKDLDEKLVDRKKQYADGKAHLYGLGLTVRAKGLKTGRRFYISYCHFAALNLQADRPRKRAAIDLWKSSLHTGFRIGEHSYLDGALMLNRSEISREVSIKCRRIETVRLAKNPYLICTAIDLSGAQIDGDIKIGTKSSRWSSTDFNSTVKGAVIMGGMKVSGDLRLSGIEIDLGAFQRRSNKKVSQSVESLPSTDQLNSDNGAILQGVRIGESEPKFDPAVLELASCNIQGVLLIDIKRWTFPASDQPNTSEAYIWSEMHRNLQLGRPVSHAELSFYKKTKIGKIGKEDDPIKYVEYDEKFYPITGKSALIHSLNEQAGNLDLNTDKKRRDYLSFFCGIVEGQGGPFYIVDCIDKGIFDGKNRPKKLELKHEEMPPDILEKLKHDTGKHLDIDRLAYILAFKLGAGEAVALGDGLLNELEAKAYYDELRPIEEKADAASGYENGPDDQDTTTDEITISSDNQGTNSDEVSDSLNGWKYTGIVHYADALFLANFHLYPDGKIEMVEDSAIAAGLDEVKNTKKIFGFREARVHHASYVNSYTDSSLTVPKLRQQISTLVDTYSTLISGIRDKIPSEKDKAARKYLQERERVVTANLDLFKNSKFGTISTEINIYIRAKEYICGIFHSCRNAVSKRYEYLIATIIPNRGDADYLVDLSSMSCAYLKDNNGLGWRFQPGLRLKAAGLSCGRVEATGENPGSNSLSASFIWENAGDNGSNTDRYGTSNGTSLGGAGKKRREWLAYQYSPKPVLREKSFSRFINPIARMTHVSRDQFVPYAYNMFAAAHQRAGENEEAQELLLERKNIENTLAFKDFSAKRSPWLRTMLTRIFLRPVKEEQGFSIIRTEWFGVRFPFLSLASLFWLAISSFAFYAIGWRQFGVEWLNRYTPWELAASNWQIMIFTLLGLILIYHFFAVFFGVGAYIFRYGFRYALSPSRGLATFGFFLLIGAFCVHGLRTGDFWSYDTDWQALTHEVSGQNGMTRLDQDVVLVLDVHYEPQIGDDTGINDDVRQIGAAGIAAASPCNLGVNSLLYAADVFIPLLDLDQRKRCRIRDVEDSDQPDPYLHWRFFKALYELMGWVITSLLILTFSGVMQRDLQKH
ncbi:MAG: ABC transporter permease [Pseudomonadota bacterium]